MKIKIITVLFIITLFAASWTTDSGITENTDDEICFERDVLPVFLKNCALSGCHNSGSAKHEFVFDSYESITTSNKGRGIVPYDLRKSKIYKKITEDTDNDRMPPPPNPPLTSQEKSLISKWILAGAPDSKCSDTGIINESIGKSKDTLIISNTAEGNCDTLNLTYKDIQPIIEKNCYKCHSGNSPSELFNLETYSQIREKADEGKLYGSVNHLPGFKSMPRKAPKLEGCDLSKINSWINSGMPE